MMTFYEFSTRARYIPERVDDSPLGEIPRTVHLADLTAAEMAIVLRDLEAASAHYHAQAVHFAAYVFERFRQHNADGKHTVREVLAAAKADEAAGVRR